MGTMSLGYRARPGRSPHLRTLGRARRSSGVTGVTADDRVERVEHCDVHNRHCPAGTPRSELFTENAVLSWSNRSMIQAAGIYRDHIPPVERIESLSWADKRRDIGSGLK